MESPSSFPKMTGPVIGGVTGLSLLYVILYLAFSKSASILGLPPPHSDYCKLTEEGEVCARSDLFAFQVVSGLAIIFASFVGFKAWHVTGRVLTSLPQTPEGRLFGYLEESEQVAAINFTFQFWDFFLTAIIPEHCSALMLGHHIMASTVSWISLKYQVLHYYGIFFLGCTEISSIFLVVLDLGKFFPPVEGTLYDSFLGVFGPLFAISFFYYRVVLWWQVSYQLFSDVYYVVSKGSAQKLRPNRHWVLYIFLFCNIPLGLLQLYWSTIILAEVQKAIFGENAEA